MFAHFKSMFAHFNSIFAHLASFETHCALSSRNSTASLLMLTPADPPSERRPLLPPLVAP
jgi:hypothetical protein